MIESYISVSQLNNYIKDIFNSEVMLQNICVFGEVSSYNISNGIAYFNLKDENGLLQCVLFGANNFKVPQIGDMVLVRGGMNYYIKGGRLSFNAVHIEPYGKGALYEKFLRLKEDLQNRGYFDLERKKQIPKYVKRIGVVTSQTGAVIRDIIDVTTRRNNTIDIVLYPVKVQGVGSEFEIARGIEFFSSYDGVDVVIVARGGGSIEDLEPFNSEVVANAAFDCKKPLVSAVGHETDFTIIDFVSDLRAPTPSAAAELVAWSKSLELENISSFLCEMEKNLINKLNFNKKDIDILYQKIDNLSSNKLLGCKNSIDNKVNKLQLFESYLEKCNFHLDKLKLIVDNLNPKKLSDIGYSKIIKDHKVVNSVSDIVPNDKLTLSMIDGKIDAIVE